MTEMAGLISMSRSTPNQHSYRNNRDGTFTDRGVEASVALNESGNRAGGHGNGAAIFDGDGISDLAKLISSMICPNLYRNN